ncbi:MAG: hypothetical protein HY332_16785 [Chloroflexi bacterium]|nr:hypothetical protein [Chloroflexota bacterium]
MMLARRPAVAPVWPDAEPVILNPAELRQLQQCYRDLLELHHAEVVEDEDFEDAHRLLVEQVFPLRQILREQQQIVDPSVELTL